MTVDLLTTGIDVPAITNLVFLRRVNSRILYDQMIGRATRLCPEIGKEVFQIYDAVDLYPTPAVDDRDEARSSSTRRSASRRCSRASTAVDDEDHRQEILDQIIVKLARKVRRMNDEIRDQYTAQAGETPEETLRRFREGPAAAVRDWARGAAGARPVLRLRRAARRAADHSDRLPPRPGDGRRARATATA